LEIDFVLRGAFTGDVDAEHFGTEPASGRAVLPSPQLRSSTFMPGVMPSRRTSASPLSRMLAAIRAKSPFSHNAWFRFTSMYFRS